jgi:hypothetical protein
MEIEALKDEVLRQAVSAVIFSTAIEYFKNRPRGNELAS